MSMQHRGYSAYQTTSVQTASPKRLLIMLYDGLILSLETAKQAISATDLPKAHQQLTKAQNIIHELRSTLNMDFEISAQLKTLYDYFYEHLVSANLKKSPELIDEVLPQIRELREAWFQAASQSAGDAAEHLEVRK